VPHTDANGIAGLVARLEGLGVPGRKFWEDDLEMPREPVLRRIEENGGVSGWVAKRTGYQLQVLARQFEIDGDCSTRALRPTVVERADELLGYVLVSAFAKGKSKVAILGLSKERLPEEVLAICRKPRPSNGAPAPEPTDDKDADEEAEEEYDTLALVFALYAAAPENLRRLFHSDKIQKTGFARMELATKARRPESSLAKVLEHAPLTRILQAFDRRKDDGRWSELKDVVASDGRFFVFIRRPHRRHYICVADGGPVVHGYDPEWIILDFEEGAKRVKISSRSDAVPLEMADCVATEYFRKPCRYDNESTITYAAQIERFLDDVAPRSRGTLVLVEMAVRNSPLKGAPKLKVSDETSNSIGPALADFARALGEPLHRVEHLDSVKVHYRHKRISLIFEKLDGKDGEYDVRYTDHRLNGFERTPFEDYMRDEHGLEILSTEKRHRRGR
jgi:hypothetical protein